MYRPPNWVKKTAFDTGVANVYLEVYKGDEVVDRVDMCDKPFYLIGRNSDVCDIVADHGSLSRQHAAILYHPLMKKFFLQDLKSAHGTFIGKTQIRNEPKPLGYNLAFGFGASTRVYKLIRGDQHQSAGTDDSETKAQVQPLILPNDQTELDLLTEKNTNRNLKNASKIITSGIKIPENLLSAKPKKRKSVVFTDNDQVINLDEIDERIGRFANIVQSTVIKSDKKRVTEAEQIKRQKLSDKIDKITYRSSSPPIGNSAPDIKKLLALTESLEAQDRILEEQQNKEKMLVNATPTLS